MPNIVRWVSNEREVCVSNASVTCLTISKEKESESFFITDSLKEKHPLALRKGAGYLLLKMVKWYMLDLMDNARCFNFLSSIYMQHSQV